MAFATARRRLVILLFASLAGLAACVIPAFDSSPSPISAASVLGAFVTGAAAVTLAFVLVRQVPRVVLTPRGVRCLRATVEWDAISAVDPVDARSTITCIRYCEPAVELAFADAGSQHVRRIGGSSLARHRGGGWGRMRVPVRWLQASPYALLAAVSLYANRADLRAELASEASTARLRSVLEDDPTAAEMYPMCLDRA